MPTAFHDSDERHEAPKCHPGTRKAILNRIVSWIEDLGARTLFVMWMYGPRRCWKVRDCKDNRGDVR